MVGSEEVERLDTRVGDGFLVISEEPCAAKFLGVPAGFFDVTASEIEFKLVGHVVYVIQNVPGIPAASDYTN
jgi:hypothetical protein